MSEPKEEPEVEIKAAAPLEEKPVREKKSDDGTRGEPKRGEKTPPSGGTISAP